MFHCPVPLLFALLCIQFLIGDSLQQKRLVCPAGKTQFPNPDDRHSFYKCDAGGNPVLYRCPEKTWFNPSLEVCDWETTSNSNGNQQPSNPSGDGSGGYWVPISQGGTNGTTGTPSGQGINGGGNSVFNINIDININGNPSGSNNPIPHFASGTGNLKQPKPTDPSNEVTTPFIDALCPSNGPLTYQNPEDCSSYFRCTKGRLVLSFCKRGKYYMPEIRRCGTYIPYRGCKFVFHPPEESSKERGFVIWV